MQSEDLEPGDYQALAEFRYRIRAFLSFSEHTARSVGLEPQQHQLILVIKGFSHDGHLTITELAEKMKLRHHSTVELVNRTEKSGLVTRTRAQHDRRHVFVSLTARGEALLQELTMYHLEELRSSGPALVRALGMLYTSLGDPQSGTTNGASPLSNTKTQS
jgi:DNA-binding MarR family transcriptional regulator